MKKFISLSLISLFLLFSLSSLAEEFPQRIFDNAKYFTKESTGLASLQQAVKIEDEIDIALNWAASAREKRGHDFAILTIDNFIGYDTHPVLAEAFYKSMDIGVGPNKTGVLYVIDLNQGCAYLHLEGDCTEWITDDMRQAIICEVEKWMQQGNYPAVLSTCWMGINDAWRTSFRGEDFPYFD